MRFNKQGVCLSPSTRDILLTLCGGHFLDKTIESLKKGNTMRATGDNWDLKISMHNMRKKSQNIDLHLFASNFIQNRIRVDHLPNDNPIGDIKTVNRQKFSLSIAEWKSYISSTKVIVSRILIDFFPEFHMFKSVYPKHIPHQYSKEMSQKSLIATLPIIDADEKSYSDCALILRTYEAWIAEIYHKAGIIEKLPEVTNQEIPEGQAAAPGQPHAHVIFTQNDPMKNCKVPTAGDQLTRVRFAGAKDLLKAAHTPSDRFEHCSPFKPVMWHTKASLLQYSYGLLFSPDSITQVGTLKYFRKKLKRKNVTPNKVLNSYEGCEELFLSLGKAYIIVAAMQFFGMENLEESPKIHKFPSNLIHQSQAKKKEYLDDVLDKFVREYILQTNPVITEKEDCIKNYGLCSIFLTILILQLKDTAKEGDGDRNLINQKLLLAVFKSLGPYSKYAIEMFTSIAQIKCTLTPRLSESYKWGFFVNWRGGAGKNIEDDVAQEICNGISKRVVQRMGPNKSISSISKICKATNGIKEITEQFDENFDIHFFLYISTFYTTYK